MDIILRQQHNGLMLWEGKSLRDLTEGDVLQIVQSGLEEHLYLEYKSELYSTNDNGRKEFLLDVGMFANTAGGILLIGIPELRDAQGQPTGIPDASAELGIQLENAEAVLASYDARVMEAIEERLSLESAAIAFGNGRRVLALRIPNSTRKPHSVRHQGHTYFPARRERQRYPINVREIKELVMRTASRREQAEQALRSSFLAVPRAPNQPYLIIGMKPVFSEEFMVDVRNMAIRGAISQFSRTGGGHLQQTNFTFQGLERPAERFEFTVRFQRDGLLNASMQLPFRNTTAGQAHEFIVTAIDVQLRSFVGHAFAVYEAAEVSPPFVVGMILRTQGPLVGMYGGPDGFVYHTPAIPVGDYPFPFVEVDDLSAGDAIIRPLCDQAHQMFGLEGSPSFNAEGVWTARYA